MANYLIKSVDPSVAQMDAKSDGRTITGYASVFGNVDSYNEIVVNGAFTRTIADRYPKNLIKLFFGHWDPIGVLSSEPVQDSTGLFVETRVATTPEAQRAYQLVKDGVASHMSIGYEIVDASTEQRGGDDIKMLKDLELWEVSAVVFPANQLAAISGVKSVGVPHIDEVRDYAKSFHQAAIGVLRKDGTYLSDADLAVIEDAKSIISKAAAEAQAWIEINRLRHVAAV